VISYFRRRSSVSRKGRLHKDGTLHQKVRLQPFREGAGDPISLRAMDIQRGCGERQERLCRSIFFSLHGVDSYHTSSQRLDTGSGVQEYRKAYFLVARLWYSMATTNKHEELKRPRPKQSHNNLADAESQYQYILSHLQHCPISSFAWRILDRRPTDIA
jgi:hypothetical protein